MRRMFAALVLATLTACSGFGGGEDWVQVAGIDPKFAGHVSQLLSDSGIPNRVEGSVLYGVSVPEEHMEEALEILQKDAARRGYWAVFGNRQ